MFKKFIILSAIFTISACDSGVSTSNGGLNEAQVQKIVAKYIDENPKALIASLEKYQEQEMQTQQDKAKSAVKDNRDKLMNPKNSFVINPDAKKYVVEFFDYNCGFCKRVTPAINKLIDEHKDVKIVFVEFPVLGASSELAASAAIVVMQKRPEKYLEFHNKLMEYNGQKDLSVINQIARDTDIRDIKFAEEVRSPEVAAVLAANRQLGDALGIRGTPAFIINDELIPGAIPYEDIVKLLDETSDSK